MKVAIVVTQLSQDSPGSFYRPYEMAKELSKLGILNQILTPFSTDIQNFHDVSMKLIPTIAGKLMLSDFAYRSIRKIVYNKRLSNIISYDKFLQSSSEKIAIGLEKCLDERPEILQGEQEVAALACIKIGKKIGVPVVADIHNIWPEELVATGYLKRESNAFKNLMKLEKSIVENADGIISVNEFMKEYLISQFDVDPHKISIIPPGGQVLFDIDEKLRLKSQTKKVIYGGLVNPREHVDLFVKSMPYVHSKSPSTKFILSKKGESAKEIKSLCNSLNLKPDFYWFQSRDKARKLFKSCYIGILPSKNDIARKLGTPLKLLEYISNGLPVVANDIGSWCNIIKENKIGILTDDNPKDFADGICILLEDKELYQEIQQNILKLLNEKYNWKISIQNILLPMYKKLKHNK